jgi:DNA mismatch endonuclease (patch repair protein)
MMAGIRSVDTAPEMLVRRYLHACGLRFRLHDRRLPGRPDIVLPRYRVAVYVHGCFWHRHNGCRYATTPATRPDFWQQKFEENRRRDASSIEQVMLTCWTPIVVWECALRNVNALDELFWRIVGCDVPSATASRPSPVSEQ